MPKMEALRQKPLKKGMAYYLEDEDEDTTTLEM